MRGCIRFLAFYLFASFWDISFGIIGVVLFSWFVIDVLRKSYNAFKKRKDRFSVFLFIGCIVGIAVFMLNSLFDWTFHQTSNGLYFFFMLAIAVSAANTKFRNSSSTPTYLKKIKVTKKVLAIPVAAVLVACILFNGGILMAKVRFPYPALSWSDLKEMTPAEIEQVRDAALSAMTCDPLEADYGHITQIPSGRC